MAAVPGPNHHPFYLLEESFGDQSWSTETIAGLIEQARELLRLDVFDLSEIQQSIHEILDNIGELWPSGGAPKELEELKAVNNEIEVRIRERELFLALNIEEWTEDAKTLTQQIDDFTPQLTTAAAISENHTLIFHLIDQASKVGQSSPGGDQVNLVLNELQAAVQRLRLQISGLTSSS